MLTLYYRRLDVVGGVDAVGGTTSRAVLLDGRTSRAAYRWVVIVVADMEPEASGVDVAVAPEKKSTEDGLGHNVKDAVKDGLGIGRDDVAALGEAPGDGVEEPEEDSPNAADDISSGDVSAEGGGVLACGPGYGPGDPEEGDTTKDEVAPLLTNKYCSVQKVGRGAEDRPCK